MLLAPKLVCFTSHIVKKKHYRCPDVSAKIKQCLLTCAVAVRAIIHTCNNTSHCKQSSNCITVQATMLLPIIMSDCVLLCDVIAGEYLAYPWCHRLPTCSRAVATLKVNKQKIYNDTCARTVVASRCYTLRLCRCDGAVGSGWHTVLV